MIHLRFSKSGAPEIERWYATHFVNTNRIAELKIEHAQVGKPDAAESGN